MDDILEMTRNEVNTLLHAWWDNHPGVLVKGKMLPIDEARLGLNRASLAFSFIAKRDAYLLTANDRTLVIEFDDILKHARDMDSQYDVVSEEWDIYADKIEAAKTVEELAVIRETIVGLIQNGKQ